MPLGTVVVDRTVSTAFRQSRRCTQNAGRDGRTSVRAIERPVAGWLDDRHPLRRYCPPVVTALNQAGINTFTGARVDPRSMQPDQVSIADIAHALSLQCRFGGHCSKFYSVAEHCLLVSSLCTPENALWGLLHDAGEAYLLDLPAPLKDAGHPLGLYYTIAEASVLETIAEHFALSLPVPDQVRAADRAALSTEWRDLMPTSPPPAGLPSPISRSICPMTPAAAEALFLERYAQLVDGGGQK